MAASEPIEPEVSTTKRMSAAPGPSLGSTLVFGGGGRHALGVVVAASVLWRRRRCRKR